MQDRSIRRISNGKLRTYRYHAETVGELISVKSTVVDRRVISPYGVLCKSSELHIMEQNARTEYSVQTTRYL